MNMIKRKTGLLAAVATLVGLTACTEWDDHYDNTVVEGSNTTLWQQVAERPELSDFAEVLTNTKVFRQHKKSPVSYAELLNGGQSLTVFAPVNGTFNKDSLIALTQTAQGDSAVEMFFVKNHLAGKLHSAADTTSKFRMLNGKYASMQHDNVSGIPFGDNNLRSKNGIMHIVQQQVPYTYTIYEALTLKEEYAGIGNALKKYNEDYFDENASLSSGLVDGIPVYVDSVVYETNKLMNAIGQLNAEDSTYYVTLPTSAGWQAAWEEAQTYFKYSADVEKADSIQHYWTSRALLDDAIFSKTIQRNMEDSVKTYRYDKEYPMYHVFHRPFDSEGIFGKAKGMNKCSNGYIYYHDEWPFTPAQTYFRKIEQEAEYTWNIPTYSTDKCNLITRTLIADSISKGGYLNIVGKDDKWNVTFKLSNTLAGNYDFCVVVLPRTVEYPNSKKNSPCKFKAKINYIDENGKERTYNCGGKSFKTDPNRVDTIVVAENFRLPACNYDRDNDKISITITCDVGRNDIGRYTRDMYLDCIFLRPNDK